MPMGWSAVLDPGEIAKNKQAKSLPYGDYISWRSWRINTYARVFPIMVTPLEEIGMVMYWVYYEHTQDSTKSSRNTTYPYYM